MAEDTEVEVLFSSHHSPSPGLHVAFTTTAAGNLAFHVTGGDFGDLTSLDALDERQSAELRRAVSDHRRALERAMGVPEGRTEYVDQVHSARVVDAAGHGWGQDDGARERADAQVSPTGEDPLAVMVADCLPVAFVSRRPGIGSARGWDGPTAVAHAGRRGLLDGVLEATVDRLRSAGAGGEPGDVRAWVGPAICGRCYEVPEQMYRDAVDRLPEAGGRTSWGTPSLDLPAGAEAVLTRLDVTVHREQRCTREDPQLYSHRRAPGQGRLAGLVWRTAADTDGETR